MSEQDSETETNETETAAPEASQASQEEAKDAEGEAKADGDDDDDDDDDEKDEKPDKPKKVKISFEASMPRNEAVSYFEAIVGGLKSGRLEFRQEADTLILNPPEQLEIEVKAQRKGDKGKVVFEIEWSDENRSLEIIN